MTAPARPPLALTSRAVTDGDDAFQRRLFEADRGSQLSDSGLPQELVTQLLDHQYLGFTEMLAARATHRELWLLGDRPAAVLHRAESDDRTEVLWIAVAPERRGSGIGRAVLEDLLARADADGLEVHLQVDPLNIAARGLYGSLGFLTRDDATLSTATAADLALIRPARPVLRSQP
ncbi:N-acetyltransferase [Nocardioides sp.]|uniref:GNAT family N-acetyltransferase n=1 Tax=Nocardioides sp. TaxID=35761 RepID=UPI0026368399|nr:N-acetyltransferase [Nocardioides sp.]